MNFLELVKARHSVRSYVERPIEQSKLDYILECVRLAPSAVNFQPWKFAVVTEKNLLDAVKSTYPREWIKTAPCIIVACGNHDAAWHRKLDDKDHTDVDVANTCVWLRQSRDSVHAGYATSMFPVAGKYWDYPKIGNR